MTLMPSHVRRLSRLSLAAIVGLIARTCSGAATSPSALAATTFGPGNASWLNYYNDPFDSSTWGPFCNGGSGDGTFVSVNSLPVPACKTTGSDNVDIPTGLQSPFTSKDSAVAYTPGFQCVELAERYLLVTQGWGALHADGDQVAGAYAAAHGLTLYMNDGNSLPVVGSVISFAKSSSCSDTNGGHVAIVTNVSVANGKGNITILGENQNGSAGIYVGGTATNTVMNNKIVAFDGDVYVDWIDPPGSVTGTGGSGSGATNGGNAYGLIDTTNAIYAQATPGSGAWVEEVGSGNASQFAMAGNNQVFLRGDGAVFAKTSIGANGWAQETPAGTAATAVAISSAGLQLMIRSDASVWSKTSIGMGAGMRKPVQGTP